MFENAAPIFQSDGNLSISENQTIVYEFNATDPDGNSLVYSILYGDDANAFDLNATSGILSFIIPPDYENPGDNNDNIYEATIQVSNLSNIPTYTHVTDVHENAAPIFQSDGLAFPRTRPSCMISMRRIPTVTRSTSFSMGMMQTRSN